jgi:hypothetical protein
MKAVLFLIGFIALYFAIDLFAGVVSPVLGPLAITSLIAIAFYWMFRLARSPR